MKPSTSPPTEAAVIALQANEHDLIDEAAITTPEQFTLQLLHEASYQHIGGASANKTLLDIGCNTGWGSAVLARHAHSVIGIDVSARALAAARARHVAENLQFLQSNGKDLPATSATVDIIVGCQIIEHILKPDSLLTEIKRVLTPSGVTVLTTPNAPLRLAPGMPPWNRFHVHEFTAAELHALLERHFANVVVLGLRAHPVLYEIEYGRAARAKYNAQHQHEFPYRLRRLMRRAAHRIEGALHSKTVIEARRCMATADLAATYTWRDAYYTATDTDTALDLLVIGSDDLTRITAFSEFVQTAK